jgi:LytS/YehU family sensor histidine kinase
MLMGPWAGAFLGFVFGAIVYVTCGVMAMDPFTAFLFNDHPVITAGICLVKSTLAGFLAGIVFRAIEKKNSLAATVTAAAITPVVNTGVFVLGCLLILNTIEGFIASAGLGVSGVYFIFIGCAGINFVFEFLVNMIFATALHRVYKAVLAKVKA